MESWSKLYKLADHIFALKPWRYMYENEITGVRDPVSGIIGFISVMGNLGEHYAITVYLGERAFGQFLELSEDGLDAAPETVLEIPQLMLSFEDRDFLEKEDRAIMKENGVKVSGRKSWPIFRSYRPGMVPWFLEENEQESMTHYLEQFLEVATRSESGQADKNHGSDDEDVVPVRECSKTGEIIKWHDTRQKIINPAITEIQYAIEPGLIEKVKAIPAGSNVYEMDFFLTPGQVRTKNKRPFFSYLLLIIDKSSGFIIFHDMLDPSDGIDRMLAKIPGLTLKALSKGKNLPKKIVVGSPRLSNLLTPLMVRLGMKFQYQKGLKSLESAKNAVFEFLSRG